jgi:hypothetical protein
LYKTYQETHEIKSDLMDSAYELASALEVENASLLVLSGNYEVLNAQIEKNLALKNREALEAAKQS